MLFNSLSFLYGFLPITFLVFWFLKTKNQRYIWLTITGYVFYSFWNFKFCALMLFSTLVSYFAGLGFLKYPKHRKFWLIAPIITDLSVLAVFKYLSFMLRSIESLLHLFAFDSHLPHFDIVLPIGISFYTFHTISYIVDSYRGAIKPTRNFFEFSCYVSLFSQLVAGPIVRFGQIENDLEQIDENRKTKSPNLAWSFFAIGMIKKVLIADSLAMIVNPALKNYAQLSSLDTWLCVLGYSYQLYFDFSGYSDMAVGLGHLFNIRIPQNFNSPYKAESISDFWRRWHISLSSCLRDYIYIPLGGSRTNECKTNRNLLITMGIGGLWHGANWTFVIWGLYHGALLTFGRMFPLLSKPFPRFVRKTNTFILVAIGWSIFRADNISMATTLLSKMFSLNVASSAVESMSARAGLCALLIAAAIIAHTFKNTFEISYQLTKKIDLLRGATIAALFIVSLMVVTSGHPSPFLYFQF